MVFRFAASLVSSINSAAKKTVASGLTVRIGPVLNFWCRYLYKKSTPNPRCFPIQSRIFVTLSNDAFTRSPSSRHLPRLPLLPLLSTPDFLHAHIFDRPLHFYVPHFIKSLAPAFLFASFPAGALVALQHVPFCADRITLSIPRVFRRTDAGFVRLFSRNKVVGYEEKENGKLVHRYFSPCSEIYHP
jgi:hypothetical protein